MDPWTVDEPAVVASAAGKSTVIDIFHARYGDALERTFSKAYSQLRSTVVQRMTARSRTLVASAFTLTDFDLVDPDDWAGLLGTTIPDTVADVVVDAMTGINPTVTDEQVTAALDKALGRLSKMGDDVRRNISETLHTAVASGFTLDETADALASTSSLSVNAAARVSQDMLASATMGGLNSAWQGTGGTKQWDTVGDGKVRPEHADANGQQVDVDDDFDIGGFPAAHPLDDRLPDDLSVGCRCSVDFFGPDGDEIPEVLDDADDSELQERAETVGVPTRSATTRPQLVEALNAQRSGMGGQRLDQLNLGQLVMRAAKFAIAGRAKMTASELREKLRLPHNGSNREQYLADVGYSPPHQVDFVRSKVRSLLGKTGLAASAAPVSLAQSVFAAFDGPAVGYVPCAGCGCQLHWTPSRQVNRAGVEVMSLVRFGDDWAPSQVAPFCKADGPVVARWTPEKFASVFG